MTEEVETSEALETAKSVATEVAIQVGTSVAVCTVMFVVIPAVRAKVVEIKLMRQLKKEQKETEKK